MNINTNRYIPDPAKYVGKYVRATTYADQVWEVRNAYVHNGVVCLDLVSLDGGTYWRSDNEHATLLPGFKQPPTEPEPVMDPVTRELVDYDE